MSSLKDISTITAAKLRSNEYAETFPEYYALRTVTENGPWHDHQNVFDHVVAVFTELEKVLSLDFLTQEQKAKITQYLQERIDTHTKQELLMVATLLHDIAKKDTLVMDKNGGSRCPGHELLGAGQVKKFSERFGLSAAEEKRVERIVRWHGFISDVLTLILSNGQMEKYVDLFRETVGDVEIELLLLMYADLHGCDLQKSAPEQFEKSAELLRKMLADV